MDIRNQYNYNLPAKLILTLALAFFLGLIGIGPIFLNPSLALTKRDSLPPLPLAQEAQPLEPVPRTHGLSLEDSQPPEKDSSEETALPAGVSEVWWTTVQEKLRRESFYLGRDTEAPATYRGHNAPAGLAFTFERQGGFVVEAAPSALSK